MSTQEIDWFPLRAGKAEKNRWRQQQQQQQRQQRQVGRHAFGPHNLSLQLVGFVVGHYAALSPKFCLWLNTNWVALSLSLTLPSPSRCVLALHLAANINSGKIYNASHMFLANEANGWQRAGRSRIRTRICVQASWPSCIRLCLHICHCVCTRMCLAPSLPGCLCVCVRVCFEKAPLVTCSIKPEMTPEPTKVTLCTVLHLAPIQLQSLSVCVCCMWQTARRQHNTIYSSWHQLHKCQGTLTENIRIPISAFDIDPEINCEILQFSLGNLWSVSFAYFFDVNVLWYNIYVNIW